MQTIFFARKVTQWMYKWRLMVVRSDRKMMVENILEDEIFQKSIWILNESREEFDFFCLRGMEIIWENKSWLLELNFKLFFKSNKVLIPNCNLFEHKKFNFKTFDIKCIFQFFKKNKKKIKKNKVKYQITKITKPLKQNTKLTSISTQNSINTI